MIPLDHTWMFFRYGRASYNLQQFMLQGRKDLVAQVAIECRLSGWEVPPLIVPQEVEDAKRDGWCMLAKGCGAIAVAVVPIHMRDEATGALLGEVVMLESRGGDLWGLLVWKQLDDDEAYESRKRSAWITRGQATQVRPSEPGTNAVASLEACP